MGRGREGGLTSTTDATLVFVFGLFPFGGQTGGVGSLPGWKNIINLELRSFFVLFHLRAVWP